MGALLLPMAGEAARSAATSMTARNARLAAELMRRGSPATSQSPGIVQSGLIPLLLSQGGHP